MNIYLFVILAVLIGKSILEITVEVLNLRHLSPRLPEEFEGYYDPGRYQKSQDYLRETTRQGLLEELLFTPLTVLFILCGGFNLVDRFARGFNLPLIPTGLIFAGVIVAAFFLLRLPFSIYRTFVIEERYGFNRTTPRTFIIDLLKTILIAVILGGGVFSLVLWFFQKTGSFAWLYCWLAVEGFQLFILFIAPVTLLPLFNRFIPLEEGELRGAIEAYAAGQAFRLQGIYKMDGSRRSSKSNAFFTGFGRFRRIALFDTLIEKLQVDELVAVLAHEVGHFRKKHIWKTFFLSLATSGLMFFILSRFLDSAGLFAAFRMDNISIYAGLFIFGFLYAPISLIFSILSAFFSRRHEYEADAFAARTASAEALISGLKKLSVDHLANLSPHPLKVFLDYSHPPILERVRALRGSTGSDR